MLQCKHCTKKCLKLVLVLDLLARTPMHKADLQKSYAKDNGDTNTSLEVHIQAPNDFLRQQNHDYVRKYLHTRRSEHDSGQLVASALKIKFPNRLVWNTLHVQENHARDAPSDLKCSDDDAAPPDKVVSSVGHDEEFAPVEKNGDFDAW